MSTSDLASVPCQRCRHLMDADAVQCEACGEVQRGSSARDRSGKVANDLLRAHRGAGEFALARPGAAGTIRPVPVRRIAKWTGVAAAGLLCLAALCFAGAWLVDSLTLQLLQGTTAAAFAALGVIALGIATAVLWLVVNAAQSWLLRLNARDAARRAEREARETAKARYDEDAVKAEKGTKLPPKPAAVEWVAPPAPRPPRPIPSQLTLVFAVMGILCGLAGVMMSLVPFFGVFAVVYPLVPAVVWTVLAWTLSFYEGSQKLLPSVSLSLIVVTLLIAWGQLMFIGAAAKGIGNEIRKTADDIRYRQQPGVASPFATPSPGQQLLNVINTGLNSQSKPQSTPSPVNTPTWRRPTPRPTPAQSR